MQFYMVSPDSQSGMFSGIFGPSVSGFSSVWWRWSWPSMSRFPTVHPNVRGDFALKSFDKNIVPLGKKQKGKSRIRKWSWKFNFVQRDGQKKALAIIIKKFIIFFDDFFREDRFKILTIEINCTKNSTFCPEHLP